MQEQIQTINDLSKLQAIFTDSIFIPQDEK